MAAPLIALLGRDPGPTDGVRDYCERLGEALAPLGHRLDVERLPWDKAGRLASTLTFARKRLGPPGRWVLLQYTAFGWSRSGVPLLALLVGAAVRSRKGRLAVVFHDSMPHGAPGVVGTARRRGQEAVMRGLYRLASVSILTPPCASVRWLPDETKALTIPVGSNVAPLGPRAPRQRLRAGPPVIAVFGVTGGPSGRSEVDLISHTVRSVRMEVPDLRVVFFGSGTREAAPLIRAGLGEPLEIRGLVEAREAHDLLEAADALLFVRGAVANGRTTAVSAIVAGTPVVGFDGPTTGHPITEAGVKLVRPGDADALAAALRSLLLNESERADMHHRNLKATEHYFSWSAIAARVSDALAH